VLANIGSGAVPGRLPNHGFRGRFRGVLRDKVLGRVPIKVLGQVLSRVPRFRGMRVREGSGAGSRQGSKVLDGFGGVQARF